MGAAHPGDRNIGNVARGNLIGTFPHQDRIHEELCTHSRQLRMGFHLVEQLLAIGSAHHLGEVNGGFHRVAALTGDEELAFPHIGGFVCDPLFQFVLREKKLRHSRQFSKKRPCRMTLEPWHPPPAQL